VLADHGLANLSPADSWQDAMTLPKPRVVIGKPVTFDALQGAILQVVARD
jgi:hypothetical protein